MTADIPFAVADPILVRAAVLPEACKHETWVELDLDDPAQDGAVLGYLTRLASDPVLAEAVAVSSPSLTHTLDRLPAAGTAGTAPAKPAEVRRAALALTRYLLRMATRPTPFGLLAGVALADLDDSGKVRLGTEHRKAVRPDSRWLGDVVTGWERAPELARAARVVANPLCTVRGDRLVLAYHVGWNAKGSPVRESSVRRTPAVVAALERCRRPVAFDDVVDHLLSAFPGVATVEPVRAMLCQLIEQGMLLTDLRPPAEEGDPLGYVLDRLRPTPGRESGELAGVARDIRAYCEAPLGAGIDRWRALSASMRAVQDAEQLAQVDLRLDLDVALPRVLAEEVERAAAALWRLHRPWPGPAHLRQYHADFLERYGADRLVPLVELLDPDRGLGAPATYEYPVSTRPLRPEPDREPDNAGLLLAIAQDALLDGGEVVLDDALIERLSGEPHDDPPRSFELYAQVLADSLPDFEAGRFLVVCGPLAGSCPAGPTFGRFAYLFREARERLQELARAGADDPRAAPVQLTFPPVQHRAANVTQAPRLLSHLLPLGQFTDPSEPDVIEPSDLFVGADRDRLYLVSESLGKRILPTGFNMLNTRTYATNPVRFVDEIANRHRGSIPVWTWGPADKLPYLPRVRYGRTVVVSAHWRVPPGLVESGLAAEVWRQRLDRWRNRWRVPDLVHATSADQRIELNLAIPLHQQILRQELQRRPQTVVQEVPGGGELGTGWLDGRVCELVIPLLPREPRPPEPAQPVRPAQTVRLAQRPDPDGSTCPERCWQRPGTSTLCATSATRTGWPG